MLTSLALYLSLMMAIYLFSYSFIEGLKISESDDHVYGGTFIFSVTMAFVFSGLTYVFL
ncbi:hypothetical protein [Aeribacillus pallidus]|uniref:hypothetical protein n=1 Tax=Aeribacillus pallidus TaxID=33936 RepID=UPI003D23684B